MIEETFLQYIKVFILKSGEELELERPNNEGLIEVKIIKRTERTLRVLGLLTISLQPLNNNEISVDPQLESIGFSSRKRVSLDDRDPQVYSWLKQGWIIKEIRFEKDEKTVRTSHYRMGFNLYQYEQLKAQKRQDQTRDEFLLIKNGILSLQGMLHSVKRKNSNPHQLENGIQNIINIIGKLELSELNTSIQFLKKWPLAKRLKYLHFVYAFCQLSLQKEEFDWKEIGASYYQKIGGSKEFDSYKKDFLEQLEEWANAPVEMVGLISLGQITPVFFAGQLDGEYATYKWGAVHALTNLSIINESFQTKATTLWLVENRAILTRMVATKDFLKQNNSLIIGIDGHVRSAHKNTISQILSNNKVEQVIIWSDYDSEGFQIAKELHLVVQQFNELTIKWILPNQQVTSDKNEYEQYLINFLQNNQMEQEQMMGGADNWKTWILD